MCFVERDMFLQDVNSEIRRILCNTVNLNRARAWISFPDSSVSNHSGVYEIRISVYWDSDERTASAPDYYIDMDFSNYKFSDRSKKQ